MSIFHLIFILEENLQLHLRSSSFFSLKTDALDHDQKQTKTGKLEQV
jgi:hypothetical protein